MKMQASTLYKASSSPSPSRSWRYHVFLNFRGEDTRKGFTDHLYASLKRKGITTFIDEKDIERGQVIAKELLKAIEDSMFAIIIFSPNYASSTCCLYELQMIVECRNNLGLTVMPVFYGVDPSDVRHQTGSFGEAFRKHEENLQGDKDKVKRWKDALREAATYCGWDSKDCYEAALVENIAEYIRKKLVLKFLSTSVYTENLVGIALRAKEVNKLMGMLNDVRFIGTWGMGGIGKTTTTRTVYKTIKGEFDVTCFLPNLRELSETNGLVHKQKELISHLNINRSDFYNLYDGKQTIRNSFDDVSEANQLENLAENKEWFGPGSRITITTRDKHLPRIDRVHGIYEVGCLVQNEAPKEDIDPFGDACCCWSLLVVVALILVVVYLVFVG